MTKNIALRDCVYELMAQLPDDKVTTYGDLAAFAGHPYAARRVGEIAHGAEGYVDLAVTISWFVVDKNLYPIIAFSMILCFFIGFSSLLFEVIRIKKAFVNERTKEVSSNITHEIQNYDVKVGP